MKNAVEKIPKNILWNFSNERSTTVEDFRKELIEYNETITAKKFDINLDQIIFQSNKVAIQYDYWDESIHEVIEPDFLIEASNDTYFTLNELLFKIHIEVHDKLKNDDHCFFEGLDFWDGEHPNYPDIPLYFLQQGS